MEGVSLPSPIFISYGACNGGDVATRFRLSEPDREAVQDTAEVCVLDAGIKKLEALLAAPPQRPDPVYDGRFTSADLSAVRALVEIAEKEQTWWRWKHTTVEIGRLTAEKPMWSSACGAERHADDAAAHRCAGSREARQDAIRFQGRRPARRPRDRASDATRLQAAWTRILLRRTRPRDARRR